jgi:hypothetical protein
MNNHDNRPSVTGNDPGQSSYHRQMAARRRSRVREVIVVIGVLMLVTILAISHRDHSNAPQSGVSAHIAQQR